MKLKALSGALHFEAVTSGITMGRRKDHFGENLFGIICTSRTRDIKKYIIPVFFGEVNATLFI